MELRHLRYFMAVAEESNFRRAAERLHVSQPALSKQVKDLEDELGTPLLHRHSSGVRLTAAGQVYLEEVRGILAQVLRATSRVREAAHGTRGRLNLGNVGPISSHFMPASLTRFREQYPEVEISLVEMGPFEQVAALEAGTIEIGFTGDAPAKLASHLKHFPVLQSSVCVAMSSAHRLAKTKHSISLADLAEEKLLCFSGENQASRHGDFLRAAFSRRGLKAGTIRFVDGLESLLALLAGGQGISLLPRVVSVARAKGVVAKPLKEHGDDLFFRLSAVWRANETSQVALNFLDILRASCPKTGKR